jgi:hypothetical protein
MVVPTKIIQASIPVVQFESTKDYEQLFNDTFNSDTMCIYDIQRVCRNHTDRLLGLVHYPPVPIKFCIDVSTFIFEICAQTFRMEIGGTDKRITRYETSAELNTSGAFA